MRGVTLGMAAIAVAAILTIVAIFTGSVVVLAFAVGAVLVAHADGQRIAHLTYARLYEGLATNLAAIGVVAQAQRNLEEREGE